MQSTAERKGVQAWGRHFENLELARLRGVDQHSSLSGNSELPKCLTPSSGDAGFACSADFVKRSSENWLTFRIPGNVSRSRAVE